MPDHLFDRDRMFQRANERAARPMVDRMHRLAPVGLTGNLADSIGVVKAGKSNRGEFGEITIGPRRKGGKKGYAGHLVEFGTRMRRVKRNGANRGTMPADPFVRPAFEQTINEVLGKIDNELGKEVATFLKRTVKK